MIAYHIIAITLAFQLATSYRFNQNVRSRSKEKKCEEVRAAICLKVNTGYNSTSFPNHLSHRSQVEAIMELNTFTPLIKLGCSKHLATFLCSLYVPLCAPGFLVLPCRALCLHAMQGCKPIMEKYTYNWNFNCTKYPDGAESNMCLGKDIKLPDSNKDRKKEKATLEGKDKIRSKKGWVFGRRNETIDLLCKDGKTIHVRKVRTSSSSKCCPVASRAVITAMCSGNSACSIPVSKSTLGAHCKGALTKLSIRYRCVHQINKLPCTD